MEAMIPSAAKRSKSAGSRTWACSMRKRNSHGWFPGAPGRQDMRRSGAPPLALLRGAACGNLLRGLKCIKGDRIGFVADRVKAELESCGRPRRAKLVQLLLLVAGNAGVVGVVGVRLGEGPRFWSPVNRP